MKEGTEMKKKYAAPEVEIIEFESEDVITTSGGVPDYSAPNTPGKEGWG